MKRAHRERADFYSICWDESQSFGVARVCKPQENLDLDLKGAFSVEQEIFFDYNGEELPDVLCTNIHGRYFTSKAMNFIIAFISTEQRYEVRKVTVRTTQGDAQEYFQVEIEPSSEILDEDRTIFASREHYLVMKPAFIREKLSTLEVFAMDSVRIYCSKKFVDAFRNEKLTGLEFEKLGSSYFDKE